MSEIDDIPPASEPDRGALRELPELVALALCALEDGGRSEFERFLASHPEQSDAIRERVAALHAAGMIDERGTVRDGATDATEFPARLGDFRLLHRLGGGGMGVVFAAEQSQPQRRVALKILRPEFRFFENARERFRREIEVLAALKHPGIVPVYAGGEEAGVQYLVMELIEGASLEEILARLSGRDPATLKGSDLRDALRDSITKHHLGAATPPRAASNEFSRLTTGTWVAACLRVVRRVAEALAHAHERGVLHRDVKPSNIMLTLDGRVLLLDFGLARDEKIETLTQSGSVIGTPAYMSPEQILGRRSAIDARTDVYSLGITLFEMLSLRSPFAADSAAEARAKVLAGDLPALRSLHRELSRDAETVCLAAIDREPTRRYASAADFAADLGNVLDLRPAKAQRASPWLRVRRAAQRHPARAIAIVATVALLLIGPSIWALNQRIANRKISAALDRANRRFELARSATETLLSKVATERLLDVPQMQPLRRELLASALDFYEHLLTEAGAQDDDPLSDETARQMARDLARVAYRAGKLANELGRSDAAVRAFARGVETARRLYTAFPDSSEDRDLLADLYLGQGISLKDAGRLDDALASVDTALALHPANATEATMVTGIERAAILGLLGRIDEAIEAHRRAQDATDGALERAAGTDRFVECARASLRNRVLLVAMLSRQTRYDACAKECLDAIAFAKSRIPDEVRWIDPEIDLLWARLDGIRGASLLRIGEFASARTALLDAKAAAARMLETFPTSGEALRAMANALNELGALIQFERERSATDEDPLPILLESSQILRRILELDPNAIDTRANLAATLINVGAELREQEIGDRGISQFEEAIRRIDEANGASAWPTAGDCLFNAAWYLALCHRELGDHRAAVSAARRILDGLPKDPRALRICAGILSSCLDLVAEDPALDDAARTQLRSELEDEALRVLRLAADHGCADVEIVGERSDFAPIRQRSEFSGILARIEENAKRAAGN